MVVGITTTYAVMPITTNCEFESHSWQSVLNTALCDKVSQLFAVSQWFSPGTPVSSTNKTNCHNITEILLKVVLNTIILTPNTVKPIKESISYLNNSYKRCFHH